MSGRPVHDRVDCWHPKRGFLSHYSIEVCSGGSTMTQWARFPKDTNRKIRKTVLIYIYGSFNGSKLGSSNINTGEVFREEE